MSNNMIKWLIKLYNILLVQWLVLKTKLLGSDRIPVIEQEWVVWSPSGIDTKVFIDGKLVQTCLSINWTEIQLNTSIELTYILGMAFKDKNVGFALQVGQLIDNLTIKATTERGSIWERSWEKLVVTQRKGGVSVDDLIIEETVVIVLQ